MTMKTNNEMNPLQELLLEREVVRKECEDSEERLAEHWAYLSDNAASLILNATFSNIAGKFGFGHKSEKKSNRNEIAHTSSAGNGILNTLTSIYPLVWDIAQPFLWKFATKKIKSLFTRKKK